MNFTIQPMVFRHDEWWILNSHGILGSVWRRGDREGRLDQHGEHRLWLPSPATAASRACHGDLRFAVFVGPTNRAQQVGIWWDFYGVLMGFSGILVGF